MYIRFLPLKLQRNSLVAFVFAESISVAFSIIKNENFSFVVYFYNKTTENVITYNAVYLDARVLRKLRDVLGKYKEGLVLGSNLSKSQVLVDAHVAVYAVVFANASHRDFLVFGRNVQLLHIRSISNDGGIYASI